MNETILVLLYYTVMLYGMASQEGHWLHAIGYVNVTLTFVLIILNSILMVYLSIKRLILWYRRRYNQS